MSDCFTVGISGYCGLSCPVLGDGECDEWEPFITDAGEDKLDIIELFWDIGYIETEKQLECILEVKNES